MILEKSGALIKTSLVPQATHRHYPLNNKLPLAILVQNSITRFYSRMQSNAFYPFVDLFQLVGLR